MAEKMNRESFTGFDDTFFEDLFDDEEAVDTTKSHREYINTDGKKCQEIITHSGNSVSTQHICVERTKLEVINDSSENTGKIDAVIDHDDF